MLLLKSQSYPQTLFNGGIINEMAIKLNNMKLQVMSNTFYIKLLYDKIVEFIKSVYVAKN